MKIEDLSIYNFILLKCMFRKNLTENLLNKIEIEGNDILCSEEHMEEVEQLIEVCVDYDVGLDDRVRFWCIDMISGEKLEIVQAMVDSAIGVMGHVYFGEKDD